MIEEVRAAAKLYRRPLAVFFLPEPPKSFDAMHDFRRHAGAQASEWTPELHGEYRRGLQQRETILELLELEHHLPRTAWRVDVSGTDEHLASLARKQLLESDRVALPRGPRKTYPREHLNAWTALLEEAGILVMATAGGEVKRSEMRAFSIYNDHVPVIAVNGTDWVRGRLFSLLHE